MASEYEKWVKRIADEARKEGFKRGFKRGFERGFRKNQMGFALKLLERGGMAVEEIAELTGLTLKSVQELVAQKAARRLVDDAGIRNPDGPVPV